MPAPRVRNLEYARGLVELRKEAFKQDAADLAKRLHAGELSVLEWRTEMRQAVKDLHVMALVISRGGEQGNVTQSEWGRVGRYLRDQYGYLDNFAHQLQQRAEMATLGLANLQSQGYIATRSSLYGGNALASFWRGVTYGLLPQVPGDGKTRCKTNCGCRLEIEAGDTPDILLVTWVMDPALENCEDCTRLAAEWNPYTLILPYEMFDQAQGMGLDLRDTVIRTIRADAEWFAGALHAAVHRHRKAA